MVTSTNAALHQLRESARAIHSEIQKRAYDLFVQKGCREGREMEDWLTAERELLCCPPSELAETEDEIRIQVAVPGFHAGVLQVSVLPHSITVEGKAQKKEAEKSEHIHFTQFGVKRMFRQFDLSSCIDPDSTTATVDEGMLRIVAKKTAAAESPIIAEVNISRSAAA